MLLEMAILFTVGTTGGIVPVADKTPYEPVNKSENCRELPHLATIRPPSSFLFWRTKKWTGGPPLKKHLQPQKERELLCSRERSSTTKEGMNNYSESA